MSSVDKAVATQLSNIEKKTGKTLAELTEIARSKELSKHSEIRDMFKSDFNLGYGDANALAHFVSKAGDQSTADTEPDSIADMWMATIRDQRLTCDRSMTALWQNWRHSARLRFRQRKHT
jgi:hypothetical protein